MGNHCVCKKDPDSPNVVGEEQIDLLKSELEQLTRECTELQEKCNQLELSHKNLEWQHQRQLLRNRELEIIRAEEEKDAAEAATGVMMASDVAHAEIQALSDQVRQLHEELGSRQISPRYMNEENHPDLEMEVAVLGVSRQRLAAALADKEEQLEQAEASIKILQEQPQPGFSPEVEALESENAALQSQRDDLQISLERKNERIAHAEAVLRKVQEESASMASVIEDSKDVEIAKLRAENRTLSAKYEEVLAAEFASPRNGQRQEEKSTKQTWSGKITEAKGRQTALHCSRSLGSKLRHENLLTPSCPSRTSPPKTSTPASFIQPCSRPRDAQIVKRPEPLCSSKSLISTSTESRPSMISSSSNSPPINSQHRVLTNIADPSFAFAPWTPKSKIPNYQEGAQRQLIQRVQSSAGTWPAREQSWPVGELSKTTTVARLASASCSRESTYGGGSFAEAGGSDCLLKTLPTRSTLLLESQISVPAQQGPEPGVHLLRLSRVRQAPLGTELVHNAKASSMNCPSVPVIRTAKVRSSPRCTGSSPSLAMSEYQASSYSTSPSRPCKVPNYSVSPKPVRRNTVPTITGGSNHR